MTAEKKNTLYIIATIVGMAIPLGGIILWAAEKDAKMAVFLYRVEQTMIDFAQEKKNHEAFKTETQKQLIEIRNENILFREQLLKDLKDK